MSGGLTVSLVLVAVTIFFQGTGIFLQYRAFWVGFCIMLATGLVDDLAGLAPLNKLLLQIGAAFSTVAVLCLEARIPVGILVTDSLVVWIVAICNAFNLLDNMDGLAGGVGIIACVTVSILLPVPAGGALIQIGLAGSLLAFLVYNFSPARVYLGDTGTHVLGFTVATLPFYSQNLIEPDWRFFAAILLTLFVPIADTIFVTLRRTLESRPVYIGGKDHISHWLVSRGLGERQTACVFYGAAISCSAIAWFMIRAG